MKSLPYTIPRRVRVFLTAFAMMMAAAIVFNIDDAHACDFLVAGPNGSAVKGPSFDKMQDGLTSGILECGPEIHRLMVITLNLDPSLEHIGVRDDPSFSTDVLGDLKRLQDVPVSGNANVHILSRVNEPPSIGVNRGFVHFATLCDGRDADTPLMCSWGQSRIKFRITALDTNADQVVDSAYHELSVYNNEGRLHMVTFWAPYREQIQHTTADLISALEAFGLDFTKAG